jgi:serine/threonine-protein kinase
MRLDRETSAEPLVVNERTLFIEALEIADPAERWRYVERACAGDARLRLLVEELLSAHEAPGPFMERPAVDLAASTRQPVSSVSAASPAPASPPGLPQAAGYEILQEVGRGGMGVVYRARQTRLKRIVALKMLLAGPHAASEQRARLRTEAEAVARLHHPNIVQIYEVGEAGNCPFLALEFVDGGNLKGQLSGTPQPALPAASLVETLARAIHYAHQNGVLHRDLKPGNILLLSAGVVSGESCPDTTHHSSLTSYQPKIADFGLAKQLPTEGGTTDAETASGAVMGTPAYMAPEQAEGRLGRVGPAADIYALGAILYEMVSGRAPFQGETALDTLTQVRFQEPIPPSRLRPNLPRDVETICLKCLAKDPARRYETAGALADDLHHFQQGEAISARRSGPLERSWRWCRRKPAWASLAAAGTGLLLAALGAGSWYIEDRAERRALQALRAAQAESDINLALAEARSRRDEAFRHADNPERWQSGLQAAFLALRRAEFLASGNEERLGGEVHTGVRELRTGLESDEEARRRAERLEQIRLELRPIVDGRLELPRTSAKYRAELREAGLVIDGTDTATLAAQVKQSCIRGQLVAALDEWADVAEDHGLYQRILQVARESDPEPWRDRFRDARIAGDRKALEALAADPALLDQPSYLIVLLGRLLAPEKPDALRVVRLAQERRPNDLWANLTLGELLYNRGRFVEATGFYRAAVAVRPRSPIVHINLGRCLHAQKDLSAAIRAYQQAIALDPRYAAAHSNLGVALDARSDVSGAIAAHQAAIAADPDYALAYYNLGNIWRNQNDLPEAVAAYQQAIALDAKLAEAHCNLGHALRQQGRFSEALAELRIGHELGSARPRWRYRSAEWIKHCERLIELERGLGSVLEGAWPAAPGELVMFGELCKYKHLYATGAALYRDGLKGDPSLASNTKTGVRYLAASCAALAGCSHGERGNRPNEQELAELRQEALAWLRADLDGWAQLLRDDAGTAAVVARMLTDWQRDRDLAGIRDDETLGRLPENEQKLWRHFWSDVAVLRQRAATK